ncbi:MAG: carboxymuconolactone decarboxylase family protein [Acidimicrobiales bacterium]
MESDVLSDREKAAILWAEHVTLNTARSRDDVFEEVSKHFDDAEIVELTLMSGLFAMFNRLMDSLRIPVEVPREVDKIKRSLHLDPDKVLGYYETVAATWPDDFPHPAAAEPGAEQG